MTDWLRAVQAAPSPPPGLLEFAATQPSLAAVWQNATRGDWVIWMAAHGLAGAASARDLVDAAVILADFASVPAWRRALRLRADAEDALRRLDAGPGDFDIGQIVAHLYLGALAGTLAGYGAYARLAGRHLLLRELALVGAFLLTCVVVAVVAERVWRSSVARAASRLTFEAAVPTALAVATAVSERSNVGQQVDGARIMRKRLAAPVAPSAPS